MNLDLEWVDHASVRWWNYVVQTGWQGALVGVVLLLLVHLAGRRWPAPLRYALLVLAFLKFACPPLLPVPTGVFSHFPSPTLLTATAERKPALTIAPQSAALVSGHGAGGLTLTR